MIGYPVIRRCADRLWPACRGAVGSRRKVGRRPSWAYIAWFGSVGTSTHVWGEAAKSAMEGSAEESGGDLRVAEVELLDVRLQDNKVVEYGAAFPASFIHSHRDGLTFGRL